MAKTPDSRITTLDDAQADAGTVAAAAAESTTPVVSMDAPVNAGMSGAKVRLTIFEAAGDVGREPVFVSLNGYAYLVPRGVTVELPEEVFNILDDAAERVTEYVQGGGIRERVIKRFSFQVHARIPAPAPAAAA